MSEDTTDIKNHTAYDIVLSAVYLPILIQTANNKKTITYGDLVQTGKELHPDNEYVQRSIPVTAGRRLNVLRQILREHSLPDLSSLVVSASSGDTGDAYHLKSEVQEIRKEVFEINWDKHANIIDTDISKIPYDEIDFSELRKRTPKVKLPTRKELLTINSDYWKENKELFPKWFRTKREVLVDLLLQGYPVEECYKQVLEQGE